ncbi:MerC domain-containing protein [Wenyingzhuangia sp. IMCC45533]
MIKLILQKPDTLGAIASSLCVIHCLATPLLFIAHTCGVHQCESSPLWWKNLDYLFLMISFVAIIHSVKNTSKKIMKITLWMNWIVLTLLIVSEQFQLLTLPEIATYVAAISLSLFHLINIKYCQCKADKCCYQ